MRKTSSMVQKQPTIKVSDSNYKSADEAEWHINKLKEALSRNLLFQSEFAQEEFSEIKNLINRTFKILNNLALHRDHAEKERRLLAW